MKYLLKAPDIHMKSTMKYPGVEWYWGHTCQCWVIEVGAGCTCWHWAQNRGVGSQTLVLDLRDWGWTGWLYMLVLGSTHQCQFVDTGIGPCWFGVVRVISMLIWGM